MLRLALAGVLALSACGPPPPPSPPTPPATTTAVPPPGRGPSPQVATAAASSSALSCATPLPAGPDFPPDDPDATRAVAGQMTEEAAQAKRLFDGERWPEAVAAMERVASGATGDDAGNRELAEYHRAVALFKAGRDDDAATAFLQIAGRRAHLKHGETLLWIARLAESKPVVVHGLSRYEASAVERFRNPQQAELHQTLLFLLGRERFARGLAAEAASFFQQVPGDGRFHQPAVECQKLLEGR